MYAAIGLVIIQVTPLPASWLEILSPHLSEILPAWQAGSLTAPSLGTWQTLSLSPEDTHLALATLLAYCMLFVSAAQRMETIEDVKRIVRWIACSALLVAAFGIIQYFTANGKFFWFYEYPYSDTLGQLKAGFTSRNHFAHFLVLGLACLSTWLMLQNKEAQAIKKTGRQKISLREPTPTTKKQVFSESILKAGICLIVFAILASMSRGGVLAMVSTIAILALCYAHAGFLRSSHLATGTILMALLMAALTMTGDYAAVTQRLASLTSNSLEKLDASGGRRTVWSANLAAFKANPISGSGAGTHRYIYPLYLSEPVPVEYTHAENGYLQIATENGLPGIVLAGLTIFSCIFWCLRTIANSNENAQTKVLISGIAAALTASLVHSIVDFVWFIPACACATILLAACALRLSQLTTQKASRPNTVEVSWWSKLNLSLATSLASLWALYVLFPAAQSSLEWDGYLLSDQASQLTAERKAIGLEQYQQNLAESEALHAQNSLANLSKTVQKYPKFARAHLRLAGSLLKRFESLQSQSENAMTVGEIREAAQASSFKNAKELQTWLKTAFGENSRLLYQARYHALRAVQHCPLQGEGYVYLAELSFLEGLGPEAVSAYNSQAKNISPHDPDVLFSIGKNELIAGNISEAIKLWTTAYRGTGKHRGLIHRVLAGTVPSDAFLETFQPDWSALENLWQAYRHAGTKGDLYDILNYAVMSAKNAVQIASPKEAGFVLLRLGLMQRDFGDLQNSLVNLEQAYSMCPDDFTVRYELARSLVSLKEFELAEPHLRWCMAQRPDIEYLHAALKQTSRANMQRLASNIKTTAK